MDSKPYLLFTLNSAIYGIEALAVKEIFFLPELIPVAEVALDIAGMVNLRGEILPIIDLNIRLGQAAQPYSLSDSIIVLESEGVRAGIIVNQVREVQLIERENIKTDLSYGRRSQSDTVISFADSRCLSGIAKVDKDLVALLDCQQLLQPTETTQDWQQKPIADSFRAANRATERRQFYPHATDGEREVLLERAESLRQSTESQDFAGLIPLAIISLNGEYFGIDLKLVREFTDIRKIASIPCCPPHIVGNMNLRGEILTLVDIRSALNLPVPNRSELTKATIVHIDDLVAGITVDEVYDVMYLHPQDIAPVPAAIRAANEEYLRGTAPYREKMMGILDLAEIFAKGRLEVNEEV